MRWRRGRRTKTWTMRTAKRRRKTRQDPGHSSPCYWHPPKCSWLRWLWCGAGCHQWLLGTSAAQCNAASLDGSVDWSPLLFCYSRGSPSRENSQTRKKKILVCSDFSGVIQLRARRSPSTAAARLSGRQWWERAPPIILIACPSTPPHHSATLYAHHVLRDPHSLRSKNG